MFGRGMFFRMLSGVIIGVKLFGLLGRKLLFGMFVRLWNDVLLSSYL